VINSLLIVDGNSIASRAYHTEKNHFFSMIHKIIIAQNNRWLPLDGLVVTFDDPDATSWRKELYPDYKAHRSQDNGRYEYIARLRQAARSAGICTMMHHEADDIIASLAVSEIRNMVIFSGDKDMMALVQPHVWLVGFEKLSDAFGMTSYQKVIYDIMDVVDKFGSTPQQVVDYKALAGDTSDNIPGVHGIGDKTAKKLLKQWVTLAGIYTHLDEIEPRTRQKLIDGKEMAVLSQSLAKMDFDVPFEINEGAARYSLTPDARATWATMVLS